MPGGLRKEGGYSHAFCPTVGKKQKKKECNAEKGAFANNSDSPSAIAARWLVWTERRAPPECTACYKRV